MSVETEYKETMLYVGGSKTSFRCDCGVNVFRKVVSASLKYRCNGCGDVWLANLDIAFVVSGLRRK